MTLNEYINSNEELRNECMEDIKAANFHRVTLEKRLYWIECTILKTVDDIDHPKLPDGTRITKKMIREWYKGLTFRDIYGGRPVGQ